MSSVKIVGLVTNAYWRELESCCEHVIMTENHLRSSILTPDMERSGKTARLFALFSVQRIYCHL